MMKNKFLSLALSLCMIFGILEVQSITAYADEYTPIAVEYYNGHKYAVYDLDINWEEAKDFCDSLGGHLVTITNASEQDFIRTLIENGASYFYWMGATDIKTEGTWEWITGESWEYTNWITKQPDNGYTGEDYLSIELSGWNDLRLNGDNGGNNTLQGAGFICEWEKISTDSSNDDLLNDYKLSFGNSITGTIPSSIPVIGGMKVGVDIPFIPLTVTFEENKFYAVIGLDVAKASEEYSYIANVGGNSQSSFEKSTKFLCENIKDSFKKAKDNYSFSKLKAKWNKAKYNYSAKFGFDADLTVIGYLEGYVNSDGKVSILDGRVGVNPSVGMSFGSQIPMSPLYWEAELKGQIEAMVSLYLNETAKNFTPNGSIGGNVTLKGGVGLGVSSVVGVSGGLEGAIGINYDMYKEKQNYLAVRGSIGAYAKAFSGPLTVFEKNFPFAEGIIWDHPSTRGSLMSFMNEVDLYGTKDYSLIDRTYASESSEFVANSGFTLFSMTPQNKTETILKTNVYTYSEPQLVEFADGTMLAVWVDDDAEREDINRTTLLYSYYDGATWTDPCDIENDNTGDYSPKLALIDDTAYIAWVNAGRVLENNAEMSEIFSVWEISAAVFDKTAEGFTDITRVTDDSAIDMLPRIFGENGNVHIAWVKNSSDNVFSEDNVYSVMTSALTSAGWSAPGKYADALSPVESLSGTVKGGEMYIAYALDMDGEQNDYSDKEVFLNNEQLTDNDVIDCKPVFMDGKLYYYSNGTVVEYDLASAESAAVIEELTTDRFQVITDGENRAVVYGKAESLITELAAVMYDAESGRWGKEIILSDLDSGISSYSGFLSNDGVIRFAINKTEITGTLESESPYGQTDLALFTVNPSCDLAIAEVTYHEELLVSGNTLELYTEITNNGELTVNDYVVHVIDEAGEVLAFTYNEEALLPGEATDFTAYYPLGENDFVPHSITVKVVPVGTEEYDEGDNSCEVVLNCENIEIENMGYSIDENGATVIYADIVNRGYSVAKDTVVKLHKGETEGEVVDSVTLDGELNTLEFEYVAFSVPFEENTVYYMTLADGENDFVVLQTKNAEENLAAAEDAKEAVEALADGSAETSSLIEEINAEIDTMLGDGVISADEAAKINTLKKQAQMSCGVLNLRFQIASGTTGESEKSDMRLISTVDALNYRETGFYITINGTKKRIATRNVYSSLVGKDGSAVTTYAPGDIFSESKWFSTYSIWNIPNSAFDSPITVQAFVVNPDGTETLGVEKTRTVRNFIRK